MKNVFLVVLGVVLSLGQVQAGLIQWDAFDAGDELAVKDQSTGIVWLDLSLTAGLDYTITADLYSGWELANVDDVEALLGNEFADIKFSGLLGEVKSYEQGCVNTSDCYASARQWQDLFGAVSGKRVYQTSSFGFYLDDTNILRMGGTYLNGTGSANRYGVDFSENYSLNYANKFANGDFNSYSTFLVKSDSLPQIMLAASSMMFKVPGPNGSLVIFSALGVLLLFQRKAIKPSL